MGGPFMCSIFMDIVGVNGFWIFLAFFHSLIGIFGIYRMKVRAEVKENPDSQFTAMPESITPVGMELNPQTEPIEEPIPSVQTTNNVSTIFGEKNENDIIIKPSDQSEIVKDPNNENKN